jgi:hypothetical protein
VSATRELLDFLASVGATIRRQGDWIVVKAGQKPVPRAVLNALRDRRQELLDLLAADRGGEAVDAGIPRQWTEGLRRLEASTSIAGMLPLERLPLIEDARRFLAEWGGEAARLGWTAKDVFGLHPVAPKDRYDAMGLVPLLHGRKVVSIAPDRATIGTPSGGTLTYYRSRPQRDAVAAWQLLQ